MIIKFDENFFIQWDIVYNLEAQNLKLGIFNFWIDNKCYPGQGVNITLNSLFYELGTNINSIQNLKDEIGNIDIKSIDFNDFESTKLVWFDTGELFQYGFGLVFGINGNSERIFYTTDFEESYSEIILPKGTLLKTLSFLQVENLLK